jgi:hypothetical protein
MYTSLPSALISTRDELVSGVTKVIHFTLDQHGLGEGLGLGCVGSGRFGPDGIPSSVITVHGDNIPSSVMTKSSSVELLLPLLPTKPV